MVYFNRIKKLWVITFWDYLIFYAMLNIFIVQIIMLITNQFSHKSVSKISNSSLDNLNVESGKRFSSQNPRFNWTDACDLIDSIEFKSSANKLVPFKIYFLAVQSDFIISRNLVFRFKDFNFVINNFHSCQNNKIKPIYYNLITRLRGGDTALTPTSSPSIIDVDTAMKLILINSLKIGIQTCFPTLMALYINYLNSGTNEESKEKAARIIVKIGQGTIGFIATVTLQAANFGAGLIFGPENINGITLLITLTTTSSGIGIIWYYLPGLLVPTFGNVVRISLIFGVASAFVAALQQSYAEFLVLLNSYFPYFIKFLEQVFIQLAASVAENSLPENTLSLIGDSLKQLPNRLKQFGMNFFDQNLLPSSYYVRYVDRKSTYSSKIVFLDPTSPTDGNSCKVLNETLGWTEYLNSLNSADPNKGAQCPIDEVFETLEETGQNISENINEKFNNNTISSPISNPKIQE